jgi:hypothetical protein
LIEEVQAFDREAIWFVMIPGILLTANEAFVRVIIDICVFKGFSAGFKMRP